jgi:hypothetical protein
MPLSAPPPRPWHLLPLGLVALALYGAAAADYLAVRLDLGPLLAWLPEGHAATLAALPTWAAAAWAVGVWAGLIGALLLLAREDGAAVALALAFLGLAGVGSALAWLSEPGAAQAVLGPEGERILAGGLALAFLLWLYARAQKTAGVLR